MDMSKNQSNASQGQGGRGQRPVRVANCSGFRNDPSWRMLEQATLGDVDFITGDYLAEANMAEHAEAYRTGKHDGYEETAWEGLSQSLEVLSRKGTKVIVNGGSLNPAGLAEKTAALAQERGLQLTVAYVSGDDILPQLGSNLSSMQEDMLKHLDSVNTDVKVKHDLFDLLKEAPLVSAVAYLGARAIVQALQVGADIVICGRVADASPVIGAAWYWHEWSDTDYDRLAGALISGHLIECSAYVTGGNFSGFTEYDPETFLNPGFPIAEIATDGTCVITKHDKTGGMINTDTVICQLLYELQGNIYLNSDVKAYLDNVSVKQVGKDRVHVSGLRGAPPPPTTKAAIFYQGGYQCQFLLNATGYGTMKKWHLLERQIRQKLQSLGIEKDFDLLEFQIVGVPQENPSSQLASTTYCRIFCEVSNTSTIKDFTTAFGEVGLQHFSGFHSSLDMRAAVPKPFIAYYPALYPQDSLDEKAVIVNSSGQSQNEIAAGHPSKYEALERRSNSDTTNAKSLSWFGPTKRMRLGDVALARSGDKGGNLNCGVFVRSSALWDWIKNYLDRERIIKLIGDDWMDDFFIERVEFPNIYAVHFVIYGILGRGVSSSSRLDCLGKGFADYLRDKLVEVPVSCLS